MDVLVKITELKYDSLRERTISIVAGSSGRTSLMDEISGSYKQFTKTLVDDKIQSATSGIINQILTKKDGGNVYAGRATPPDNAELGDIWFKDTGGGDVELYEFDGVNWVRKMYKGFGDDVRQLVDDKIAESNALFTGAIDEQAEAVEQANALAQLAKTEAANASLSAAAANQDAQQAIADAANAISDAEAANDLAQEAITQANSARTELLGRVNTLDSKAEELNTKSTNLQTQADSIASQLDTMSAEEMIYRSDIEGTLSQYSSTIQDIDGKVDNNTSQITQQATQIASKVSQTDFNAEKTKISNLQTSITQQAGQIALKADKTYVDTVKQTVDSNTTSITQQADQIALKADTTTVNNLTGRVTNAESSITQQATQIASKVSQTDFNTEKTKITNLQTSVTQQADQIALKADTTTVNNLTGRVTNAESSITQQATKIASKVSQTDVTSIIDNRTDLAKKTDIPTYVGGKNIIRNSAFDNAIDGSERFTVGGVTYVNKRIPNWNNLYNGGIPNPTTSYHAIYNESFNGKGPVIEFNESDGSRNWKALNAILQASDLVARNYTFSADIYANGTGTKIWFGFYYSNKSGVRNFNSGLTTVNITKINEWHRVSGSITLNNDIDLTKGVNFYIYSYNFTSNSILYLTKPQLEEGTVPTAYGESQSDIDRRNDAALGIERTKISNLQTSVTQQADQIALKANQTELNNLTGRVSTAESSITQQATQIASKVSQTDFNTEKTKITNLQTSVNQQAGQIALKAEKTYVDTVKQTVDSHTTSIAQQADQIALKANQTDYNNLTGRMSTAESSITQNATEISKRLTSTQVNQAILVDKQIKDTRSENQNPQWYWTNYPKQTVEEFKGVSAIGLTSASTYAILTTNVHWTDSSGGKIKQTAKTDNATFERYGTGTTWDPWIKIANSSDLANYTTKTEFQTVKETTSLYERVIGSTEVDVKDKIARIVMTDSSFVTEVAKKTDIPTTLGGRNLAQKTSADWSTPYTNFYGTTNKCPNLYKILIDDLVVGDRLKSRIVLKYTNIVPASGQTTMIWLQGDGNVTGWNAGSYNSSPARTISGSGEMVFEHEFKITADHLKNNHFNWAFRTDYIASGSLQWKLAKVEKGPLWTSWIPAPEDSEAALTVVSTRVEQTANSYSIKFLNGANDITTQLNLTNSGARIKSSLIHLDGNVTVSGTAWMDGAVIKNLSADKITTGTLNANNVNITNLSVNQVSGITATYLQSVIGTAFIDWMKGKVIQGYNENMTIDLLGGNVTLKSGSNAIKRIKGAHTAFVHFNDVNGSYDGDVGSIYAAIGVTSSGDGVNSMSSGRFAGLRAFRAANGTDHEATLDQTEIYGDKVVILDDFSLVRGFQIRPVNLDKRYDLNDDILNPIRFFVKLLLHLNNVGWDWQNRAFIDALRNEWNAYGMSRYGTFRNNTIYYP